MAPADLLGIQRSDDYYLAGGDFYCLAENKLFRIHRYFFERESRFFKAQLAIPATPGGPRLGTADDSAILLDNVRSKDFAKLLWVFYNPKYSLYDASIEDWSTILELADRWEFAEVKNLAVRELEKKFEFPDIDRIVLYHKFKVDESYLIPRYANLCQREELLTVEEGLRLGMEVVIALTRTRECMRNGMSGGSPDGWRSPTPRGIDEKDLEDLIKDHFNIKPPQQPTADPQQPEQPKSPADPAKPNTDSAKSDGTSAGAGNKTSGGNGGKSNANGAAATGAAATGAAATGAGTTGTGATGAGATGAGANSTGGGGTGTTRKNKGGSWGGGNSS